MGSALFTIASLTLVVGVYFYWQQVRAQTSVPNPGTWLIWVPIAAFNYDTYATVMHEVTLPGLITLVATFGIFWIFLYTLVKGRFGMIGVTEVICVMLASAIWIYRHKTQDDIMANLLLQGVFLISFIPTVLGLLRGTLREKMRPWAIAVLAYTIQIIAIVVDWEPGSTIKLAHPILNGVVGNGSVALMILWNRRHPCVRATVAK